MKRILGMMLVIVTCSSCFCVRAQMAVSAQSCILVEALTGHILYEKDADAVMPMASTTKLFTALMIRECCQLDEIVTISDSAAKVEGSSSNLQAGEKISVEQLLYALLLSSGNDAAEALAEHAFDGNRDAFIDYMNRRAREMGLVSTAFTNPSGLPDESHYTTARELAQIGRFAHRDSVISRIVASKSVTFTTVDGVTHSYSNHNSLLRMYDYATGMKTGFTKAAGRCLVSSAVRGGIALICVTLRAPNDWEDHEQLLDFGFSQLTLTKQADAGEISCEIPVAGGASSSVMATNSMPIFLPNTQDGLHYEIIPQTSAVRFAPIRKGQVVAKAEIRCNGRTVSEIDLCAGEDIARSSSVTKSFQMEWQRILNFLLL